MWQGILIRNISSYDLITLMVVFLPLLQEYVCMYVKNIQLIPIRKVEIYGSYKTSVIWKKKKNVAVTAFGWDAKTS